ncbi:mitochondrial DNA helicase [Chironomus tepperi]|uniref:mitochondrial DNA helicase n=1 Tax=Chironomus tepperi TaxID=113505 RepID=UPI00391F532C
MFSKYLLPNRFNLIVNRHWHLTRIKKSEFSTTQSFLINLKDEIDKDSTSVIQIKKVLKSNNISYQDGITNIKTSCPVCEKSEDQSNDIYINKTTGYFLCPSCQYGGKFGLIEKFFTQSRSPQKVNELKTYQKLFNNSKEQTVRNQLDFKRHLDNFQAVTEENVDEIFVKFGINDRISKNTLMTLNTRYCTDTNKLIFPILDILGQCVGYKTVEIDDNGEWKESCTPDSNCTGLLVYNNSKAVKFKEKDSQQSAIIVLNILDLLALTTTRINSTFICLPYGLKFLPQECLPIFDQFGELVLWFNYNTAGWDVARNFAKKLDEKRCKFVRPTLSQPTPYKALESNVDIKGIYSKSLPILHKAITTFSSLRQDVLSDLQNIDKVQGVKWKRYPTLNKYLKGHRKGELTILTGPTGSGKTTFMSDYSLDLSIQGVSTLWGSFEIRNTRLATTLLRQFAGKPLLDSVTEDNLLEFENFANKFQELPIYFMTFHGEQQIKVVMEAIEHAQYVHDINHVIIDNVQFMMGMADDSKHIDRYYKQDVIIAAFRTFATKKNCHVTLVIHPRKEKDSDDLTTSSIFGGAKATQEADNVLIIQDKRLTSVRGKKYLQIAKNRYSGDLGIMPLEFDKQSLSYAQKPKKKPELTENSDQSTEVLKENV